MNRIVVIACSTGGPKALQSVLPKLPKNIDAPVIVVQHILRGFTKTLAERLNIISDITVKEAEDEEVLKKGCVYIAPGGHHLMCRKSRGNTGKVTFSDEPPREGVKPCANYTFESLIQSNYDEVVCVVMTGMGADGTEGIRNLSKHRPVYVIAQDKESSTVYGMPRSIVESMEVDKVVRLEEIAHEIILKTGVRDDGR